jgi:outer membrane receptor protein involved in Fe transport
MQGTKDLVKTRTYSTLARHAFFVVALGVTAPLAAQDERLDLAAEADVQFELGVQAQRAGDFRSALGHYLSSQRLAPNPNVAFNVAVCFEELGRFAEAFRYYTEFLASSEVSTDEQRLAEVALRRVRRRVALVRVQSEPPGAVIFIDRRDLGARGRTPSTLAVEPGAHRFLLELDGHEPAQSQTVEATVGAEGTVQIRLTPIFGEVRVMGTPDVATVHVDDPEAASSGTVGERLQVLPGRRVLFVRAPGHQTRRYEVDVPPRGSTRLDVELPREAGTLVVDTNERGALVEVDGEAAGFTPIVLTDVPAGLRLVRISLEGFRAYTEEVEVRPRQSTRVEPRLRSAQEIVAASRQAESTDEAPASVSLISQEELRAFGYQTIVDAVAGQRGIYQSNDGTYASIGLRGFSQPQDYGNRLLTLVDGHTMNDDMLGSSYVGYDARVDLLDVERIELVRGPGSVLYGSNAFFGVINLVTRDRESALPPHVSVASDGGTARLRVGASHRISRDAGYWVSAGGVWSGGDDLRFDDLDEEVRDRDGFWAAAAAARAWWGDVTLQTQWNHRDKDYATGAFETLLGDGRAEARDTRGFVELRWEPSFGDRVSLVARAYGDVYRFGGDYPYEDGDGGLYRDEYRGSWLGGELRGVIRATDWLRFTLGAEGRRSIQAELRGASALDDDGNPNDELTIDEEPNLSIVGGYVLANVRAARWMTIDVGARFDFVSTDTPNIDPITGTRDAATTTQEAVSPRGAVILSPWDGGTVKLLGGGSFRAPSPYELRYNDGGFTQVAPPAGSLDAERIWTGELEVAHRLDAVVLSANAYYNRIDNLVAFELDSNDLFVYGNLNEDAQTLGAEAEVRREMRRGWMVAASYAWQRTRVGDLFGSRAERLPNSPEHLASVRGIVPLAPEVANLALRLRVESRRRVLVFDEDGGESLERGDVPLLMDLVFSGEFSRWNLSYVLGVRNAFGWRYSYPAGGELPTSRVPQPGRQFFVQTTLCY